MIQIPATKTIGIIGGGQLGCMTMEEGSKYGITFYTLDAADAPARHLSRNHLVGSILDGEAIKQLSSNCDVLTFEIEHVNIDALETLEVQGKRVIPSARTLRTIADKGLQKLFYQTHKIPSADFRLVNKPDKWLSALHEMGITGQFVAKTRTGGYDGKGVQICTYSDIANGIIPFEGACVLEAFIECENELAVIVACRITANGEREYATYPAAEMVFDPKLNLVDTLICPARITEAQQRLAKEIAHQVVAHLKDEGVFAVELFLAKDGRILVNETAPRPHNSGHHSIESSYTSQYEQLIRILQGWPLGSTHTLQPAAMINLIGPSGFQGAYILKQTEALLHTSGVYIHMYGKTESRPGRKLGHITLLAENMETLLEKIELVKGMLEIGEG
jgi:5-(carboxyamino)imidazole ribonucleotide synthase